jgi:hypothetical protein
MLRNLVDLLFTILGIFSLFLLLIGTPIGVIYFVRSGSTTDLQKKQRYMKMGKLLTIGGCICLPIIVILFFIVQLFLVSTGQNNNTTPELPCPTMQGGQPTPTNCLINETSTP